MVSSSLYRKNKRKNNIWMRLFLYLFSLKSFISSNALFLKLCVVCDSTLTDAQIAAQTTVLNNKFAVANVAFKPTTLRCTTTQQSAWNTNCANEANDQNRCINYLSTISSQIAHTGILSVAGKINDAVGLLGISSNIPPTYIQTNNYVFAESRTYPQGSLYPYDLGYTLVHEIGHFLGL